MMIKKILFGSICAAAFCGWSGEFSSGGTSFDFSSFKPETTSSADKSKNIIVNGSFEAPGTDFLPKTRWGAWRGNVNIHGKTPNAQEIRKICTRGVSAADPADGKFSVCLKTPGNVVKLAPKLVISNRIVQEVSIPETQEESVWELRFKMRGRHLPSYGTSALVVLYTPLKKIKTAKGERLTPFKTYQSKSFTLRPGWSDGRVTVKAPAGTAGFYICPALYGAGEAWLDDFTLVPAQADSEVQVRVSPQGFMDNLYAVGEELPAMINFAFAADKAPNKKGLLLEVLLPPGFQALGTREFVPLLSQKRLADGTTRVLIGLHLLPPMAFTRKFFKMHAAVLMVKAPGIKSSSRRYALRYRLIRGNWAGKQHSLDLQVIPAVHGKRPARFRTAAMIGMEFRFKGGMAKHAAGFYDASGFSCVHGAQEDLSAELKKLGIIRYRGHYYICNGFRIGKGERPDFARFKMIDGKDFPRKICPVEVYKEGEFFRSNVVKLIEDLIVKEDAAENIMTNWEPYYLNSKGCFCLRCRKEFIKWSKGTPSAAEITAAWPKKTLQRHGEQWMKFRSWQHGRLMVTLEKTVQKIGAKVGKDSHFIPEVSWSSMTPQMNFWSKQYNVTDYISELSWLEPWGPYNCWYWDKPYSYYPAPQLTSYLAAEQVKKFAESKAKPGRMPKLIAFPHGRMGDTTVSQPEAIAFEMLTYFLRRWQGAFLFTFPGGYDYRYWGKAAEANTLIARHEEMVERGKEVSSMLKIVPRTPCPEKPDFAPDWAEPQPGQGKLPGLHKLKIFQGHLFFRSGEYLAAVGNFWQKGELFFEMRLEGLQKGKWYVSVGKYDLGCYTAAELAKGILLQAGALRWQFITISPRRKENLKPFTQAQMKELMKKRLPGIRKAYRFEEQLHRSRMAAEEVDLKGVKSVTSKGVTAAPAGNTIVVKTPVYTAAADLKQGGRIVSLQSRGEEFVRGSRKGWFAVPGVWYPRKSTFMLVNPVELRRLERTSDGVRLQLYRKLTPMDQQNLAGAGMLIQYEFKAGKILFSSRIINETHDALEYAFRYHSLPAILGKRGNVTGEVIWHDGLRYRRGYVVHLCHYGAKDPLMTGKNFNISAETPIFARELTLRAPFYKGKLRMTFPVNVRQIVFWDSAGQESSTFEVIYDRKILHPKEEAEYTMELKFD